MKDLKNLKGAKMLSKNDQISIKGGFPGVCPPPVVCHPEDDCCIDGMCGRIQEWNNNLCYAV